ncbi:MAG: tripartite tricarboxylate transporter TctB family protein [Sphaerochaeta sp.]|nr:tripartite tricarboxylate transporter TctB family protein [Sphaerochaeta sp.]
MGKTEKRFENIIFVIFIIGFSYLLYVARTSESYSFDGVASMAFPSWIFIITIVLCSVGLVRNLLIKWKETAPQEPKTDLRIYLSLVFIIIYAALWNILGFCFSTILFLIIESKMLRPSCDWKKVTLIAISMTAFLVFIFGVLFNVDFPEPLIELLLG